MWQARTMLPRKSDLRLTGLAAILLIAGCGPGSGQGLDSEGNLVSGGAPSIGLGASGNPNATLAWVQANVFGGVCSQCHTGASAPLGLDWSSSTRTCGNVGRISAEIPSLMEIASTNTAASYLVWKIEGAGPSNEPIQGVRMPASNPALTAETIQNIRDWVADGVPGC